jgi:hypothetical protein
MIKAAEVSMEHIAFNFVQRSGEKPARQCHFA